jgi:hypothetical protein
MEPISNDTGDNGESVYVRSCDYMIQAVLCQTVVVIQFVLWLKRFISPVMCLIIKNMDEIVLQQGFNNKFLVKLAKIPDFCRMLLQEV